MVRLLTFLFSLIFAVSLWAQEDHSTRYVAHYAMETAKAKNFKDLAENLFPNPFERKEVLVFLKKHDLLKRSLPDVIAEGSQLIIKERKRNTILDLSQLPQMKFVFNNENLKFTGRESFLELYQKLTILHGKKQAGGRMQIFMSEAFADLPVLATVALAQYAKASMIAQMHDQSCPQNPSACETHAKNLQKEIPHLVIKSCKSQSGHWRFRQMKSSRDMCKPCSTI